MKYHRIISALARFSFGYPILMLCSLYLTWLVAWAVLGHMPRPSLDDPKSINIIVDVPYMLTYLLMACAPGAMVLGAALTPLHLYPYAASKKALFTGTAIAIVILIALWGAAFGLCRWDPWNVVKWFMD